jgi:hypothetical protein
MDKEFRNFLMERKMSQKDTDFAINSVKEFEEYLEKKNLYFESAGIDILKEYLSMLIGDGKNSMERLRAIARYCYLAEKNELYIYFTSILNARNVLPDIGKRLASIAGEGTRRKVFQGFKLPPLGSPPPEYAKLTHMIISRLETELPRETCKEILTWNYHNIPAEAFKALKERLIIIACIPFGLLVIPASMEGSDISEALISAFTGIRKEQSRDLHGC